MTNDPGNHPIRSFIPGIFLAGLLVLSFVVMHELLLTLIWALIIGYVLWPMYRVVRPFCNDNANWTAGLMTGLIAACVLLSIYWLLATLQTELRQTYQSLASSFDIAGFVLPEWVRKIPWLGDYAQQWVDRFSDDREAFTKQAIDWARQWLGQLAGWLGGFLGGVGTNVVKFSVILVTVFFCFRDGEEFIAQLQRGLLRYLGRYGQVCLEAAGNTTRAVVYGLVLAALAQGFVAGIGYAVAGVNAPVLFGAMTALLALIPMGATLVWLPIGVSLLLSNHVLQGVGLLLWGFLAVSTIDNLIRPIVISGASRVPFLVVMFGVFGGLTAFGAVGIFMGPSVLAVLLAVWQTWLTQQADLEGLAESHEVAPVPSESRETIWHAISVEEALESQRTDPARGLNGEEVQRRLAMYGANTLKPVAARSALKRFFVQFHNVLIYVLLASAAITASIGHWTDSAVIFGVVLINAIIGFIQEGKAERALEAIRKLLTHEARVRRDQADFVIPAEQLAPGDIVSLESGDRVPADLRLIEVRNLRVNESMLSGESAPVEKNILAVESRATLADRSCMTYASTLVTYGSALGVVVATGDRSELGHINSLLREVLDISTPLLRQIAVFSQWLIAVILVIAFGIVLFGRMFHDSSLTELFLASVGFAVAAIPEGLPAIMTITLAIGVQRMAMRKAIIRRLPAVETLGSVTVICTDKTGTLTCNEMTVKSVFANQTLFEVTGSGYAPEGGFEIAGTPVGPEFCPVLIELAKACLLCNNAALKYQDGNWVIQGDPTEAALITLARKAKLDPQVLHREMPRTDFIPFESERRYMASLHQARDGQALLFVKGAPERVLAMCDRERRTGQDSSIDSPFWHRLMEELAGRGQRLIAVAMKTLPSNRRQIEMNDAESGFCLLGLVGMIDPPRPEALDAVRRCQQAGIRVKMITGDHAVTAAAIASRLQIGEGSVLRGEDLDRLNDDELRQAIRNVDVFARASPEHKLRLVQALKADGQVVAMTGDGVNDAPALKQADVGIAMGRQGTEVAKEASEMVLTDDDFASIVRAIEEGRGIYDNLKKAIIYILPNNGGEALTIVVAVLMGLTLPITPVQILWVNMVTEVTLSVTLAFEAPEKNIMNRAPRNPSEPILSGFLVWRVMFVSLIFLGGTYGLFYDSLSLGISIESARTIALNTLVMFEIFYVFNSRYLYDSVLNGRGLFGNRLIWLAIGVLLAAQVAITYWRPLQALFGTAAIEAFQWVRIALVASTVFFLVELEKFLIRRSFSKSSAKTTGVLK